MRTRHGSYPSPSDGITFFIRPSPRSPKRRRLFLPSQLLLPRTSPSRAPLAVSSSPFDSLTDDLVLCIIASLGSSASCPSDLVNAMLTCKRFCAAATHPQVLAHVSTSALAMRASGWSDGAYRLLTQCAHAGNIEAAYTLGMIRFYCFHDYDGGASIMFQAAIASHASALHSLAIIQFNGSGGSRKDKNLKNGASLCAKAVNLGHIDAMRELGHCLQDGYGVPKNVHEGRRLLLEANAREAAAAIAASPRAFVETALQFAQTSGARCLHRHLQYRYVKVEAAQMAVAGNPVGPNSDVLPVERHPVYRLLHCGGCSLLSDFGCNVPPAKLHIANKFLADWFALRPPASGLRLCSHVNCGRPETRRHEFRRCSACGTVNYCSRACQALDWKVRHKHDCTPVADWEGREENDGEEDDQVDVYET